MFKLHNKYTFRIAYKQTWDGVDYFVLSYNNEITMPGYEQFRFRTKVLPFQRDWEQDDYDAHPLVCYVYDFNRIKNQPTKFPILYQDIPTILHEYYCVGQKYPFTVEVPQGTLLANGEIQPNNILRDQYGVAHFLYHEGVEYSVGQRVELVVKEIGHTRLKFVNPDVVTIAETFKVGDQCEFEVVKVEASHLHVKDKQKGIIHRYRPSVRKSHDVGDTLWLKVCDFKNGRLCLAPTNAQSIADITAQVKTIESNSIGEEGQTVEYKSSFVFTCKGAAAIETQLNQEIMRQVAAFMNSKGGTIYIGYRDDGSVCGIEQDLEYINDDASDKFNPYKLTTDGIILKFQNTISRILGSLASFNASVQIKKDEHSGKLVCMLDIKPSLDLVWLDKRLFVRSQNRVVELFCNEIIQYHEARKREWK